MTKVRCWTHPALLMSFAALPSFAASAQITQHAPGVGWNAQGADIAVLRLDPGDLPDMILMAYDHPPTGPNTFRYIVGRNLDTHGYPTGGWSPPNIVSGIGTDAQGAGMVIGNFDLNLRPDIVLMAYYHPSGGNFFRYKVGYNLNANGVTNQWSVVHQVPGLGWDAQGAAAALGHIDANPRPDMVLVAYDNPAGGNNFRYRIGWNVNAAGAALWNNTTYQVPGFGWEGQGAGAALANLDNNPRPELVLMAYDNPAGNNSFRFVVGWNLNLAGAATNWTVMPTLGGVGWEAEGAGLSLACLDSDPRLDWIFMAYDNPQGNNSFVYRVVPNYGGSCG